MYIYNMYTYSAGAGVYRCTQVPVQYIARTMYDVHTGSNMYYVCAGGRRVAGTVDQSRPDQMVYVQVVC